MFLSKRAITCCHLVIIHTTFAISHNTHLISMTNVLLVLLIANVLILSILMNKINEDIHEFRGEEGADCFL